MSCEGETYVSLSLVGLYTCCSKDDLSFIFDNSGRACF